MTTMCDFDDYIIYQNKDKNDAGISIGLKIFSLITLVSLIAVYILIVFFRNFAAMYTNT